MIRTTILILIGIFAFHCTYGQQKFIEVVVHDTIQVTPDEILYRLTINADEGSALSGFKKENFIDVNLLDEILAKYSDLKPIVDNPNTLRADIYESLINIKTLRTKSPRSINKLIQELSDYSNISGSISELIIYDTNEHEVQLKKKLIRQSKIKAEETARIIGNALGEILEITENAFVDESKAANDENGGWTAYPPLSGLGRLFGFTNTEMKKQIYSQKIRVKYVLK